MGVIHEKLYIFFPSFFTTGRNIYVSDYKHLAAEKISCRFACLVKEKMYIRFRIGLSTGKVDR